MQYVVSQVSDWKQIAQEIVSHAVKHGVHVVLLSGDLGAGKTTFVQELARFFAVRETVSSPTFVVRKSYPLAHDQWKMFVHADLYRLNDPRDLQLAGIEADLRNEQAFVCIEWPEQIPQVKHVSHIAITITHASGEERSVSMNVVSY